MIENDMLGYDVLSMLHLIGARKRQAKLLGIPDSVTAESHIG